MSEMSYNEDYQKIRDSELLKGLLQIPDNFLNKLNPLELFHLS